MKILRTSDLGDFELSCKGLFFWTIALHFAFDKELRGLRKSKQRFFPITFYRYLGLKGYLEPLLPVVNVTGHCTQSQQLKLVSRRENKAFKLSLVSKCDKKKDSMCNSVQPQLPDLHLH